MTHTKAAKMFDKYPQVQWVALDTNRHDEHGDPLLVMGRADRADLEQDVAWYLTRRPDAAITYVKRLPN